MSTRLKSASRQNLKVVALEAISWFRRNICAIMKYIILNGIILFATVCYIITLVGCEKTSAQCLIDFDQTTLKKFFLVLVISALLFTLTYVLWIAKQIHCIVPGYQTLLLTYLCFVYDTGSNLKSHGAFNRVFLFAFMLVAFIIQMTIYAICVTITKLKKVGICLLCAFVIILAVSAKLKISRSCANWTQGLGNVRIDNTLPGCEIKVPSQCWMNIMSGYLDISKWLGENCEQIRMDSREVFNDWTNANVHHAKVLGYPRTENEHFFPTSTLNVYQFFVLKWIIDMENPRIDDGFKQNVEYIVNFTAPNPEVGIRVTRNEELITQRRNLRKRYSSWRKFSAQNVIHFFIDSLSRDNLRRKLPKTFEWLNSRYENDNIDGRVFQFLKYHSIASWTLANLVPIEFGVESTFHGSPVHMNFYYKQSGFILGQAHGACTREIYDIEPGNLESFHFQSFDHDGSVFACDPNYTVPRHPYSLFNGNYGMKRRCLYGKDTHHYFFEYGKKFWKAYSDQPKFLRIGFQDGHEGTSEVVGYMDEPIIDFLNFLESEGSFRNTVILFHSDHGTNMPGFFTMIDAEDYYIEKSLPPFYLIVPKEIGREYGDILKKKENMMQTPYDIHNTFMDLANAPKFAYNNVGHSVFMKTEDFESRTCDRFKVLDPYCMCVGERDN